MFQASNPNKVTDRSEDNFVKSDLEEGHGHLKALCLFDSGHVGLFSKMPLVRTPSPFWATNGNRASGETTNGRENSLARANVERVGPMEVSLSEWVGLECY